MNDGTIAQACQSESKGRLMVFMDKAFAMVTPVVFGVFVGRYLDQVFKTQPTIMITLTFLGLATGMWSIIKQAYFVPPPPPPKKPADPPPSDTP